MTHLIMNPYLSFISFKKQIVLSFLLVISMAASAFSEDLNRIVAKDIPSIPNGTIIMKDIAYVKNAHERQKLDLFLPPNPGEKIPLLVWFHGGGWEGGDKANCAFQQFVGQNYAVASVNYRLSQDAIFPAQICDCKSAIRWLRAHADEFGFDSERIGVGGDSAGGHLVALLGATGHTRIFDEGEYLEQTSRVQVVCDFFGPTDFEHFDYEKTIFSDVKNSCFARLIGGDPNEMKSVLPMLSPRKFVTSTHAPIIIIHGNKDDLVPLNQSQMYLETLAQAGVESTLLVVDGAGHGFGGMNHWMEIGAFMSKHLKPEKRVGYTRTLLLP